MRKRSGPSRTERLVTAVFSDPYHTLHLVEVRTRVRREIPNEEHDGSYRVNKNEVEAMARKRLKPIPYNESRYSDGYDLVGILVSHDDPLHRGRITWATEVEVVETEQV